MLEAFAFQHAVINEPADLPFNSELAAIVAEPAPGWNQQGVTLGSGSVMKFVGDSIIVNRAEAMAINEEKKPIGPQIWHTIDASATGKITVTTKNYGHGADGKYGDPNVPASSWINGVFQGHGIPANKALARAIETGALPANATQADLAKAGNDLYFSIKLPDGVRTAAGESRTVIGELFGVENHDKDITTSGEVDVVKILADKGVTLTRAQLAKLEILTQEKGLGGYSLSTVVVAAVKPVTPETTVPSTTIAPTTTSSTTTSTTAPAETTTTTIAEPTTTVAKTTTTEGTTTTASEETTTTVIDSTTTTVETEEATPDCYDETCGPVSPDTPDRLADTGEDSDDAAKNGALGILIGSLMLLALRARRIQQKAEYAIALADTED